jgi:hypothetical protein
MPPNAVEESRHAASDHKGDPTEDEANFPPPAPGLGKECLWIVVGRLARGLVRDGHGSL